MISRNGKLRMIKHPYINSIYLEQDQFAPRPEDVLVIETNIDFEEAEFNAKDDRLIELLTDLNELQMMAEQKVGTFDRVDIRSH